MNLWLVEGWLIVVTGAYAISCHRKKNKIEIMSVDRVLRRIKRKTDADNSSMF